MGVAAAIFWQQQRINRLTVDAAILREQLAQAAPLSEENDRLAEQLRTATNRANADLGELLRLRAQSARTRRVEQENAELKLERARAAERMQRSVADSPSDGDQGDQGPKTPEEKFQRIKGAFGRDLGMALVRAAMANNGIVPTNLGPLLDTVESLSGAREHNIRAKQFELVYQGSLYDVDVSQTILAREKEPIQGPDGKWLRLYVVADGSSQWVAADTRDGFAAREQQFWPGHFKR